MTSTPDRPSHHCPGCGVLLPSYPRYPWYFCHACLAKAEDLDGRQLVFGNASLSGGLTWAYADDPARRDDSALRVICMIAGRPVLVHEARFGGVVAEPLSGSPVPPSPQTVNLVSRAWLQQGQSRLVD
ncbi:MAG: hypothetical protein KDJ74_17725 [Notoacmeibacter sp.]|nr:hypothetical protein [Notoacmeibacter sp.]